MISYLEEVSVVIAYMGMQISITLGFIDKGNLSFIIDLNLNHAIVGGPMISFLILINTLNVVEVTKLHTHRNTTLSCS